MDFDSELGLKSFSLRTITDNAEVAAITRRCGLAAIDLSRSHVDFARPETFDGIIAAYRDAGVAIVGIGVVPLGEDSARTEAYVDFCRRAGCRTISVNYPPGGTHTILREAAAIAADHGMRLAIHNHGGHHWLGNSQMLRWVLDESDEHVGICIDTAWCLDAGEDPLAWMERFGQRIHAVHLKDFVFDRAGRGSDVVIGESNLDLPAFLKALQDHDFDGPLVIEYEGEDPAPAIAACAEAARASLRTPTG